jgi:hypothetical protein
MICRVTDFEEVVLVSHNPVSVFTTTPVHLNDLTPKPDGHYDREELLRLVEQGHAVHYDEKAVRAVARGVDILIFGCPPTP